MKKITKCLVFTCICLMMFVSVRAYAEQSSFIDMNGDSHTIKHERNRTIYLDKSTLLFRSYNLCVNNEITFVMPNDRSFGYISSCSSSKSGVIGLSKSSSECTIWGNTKGDTTLTIKYTFNDGTGDYYYYKIDLSVYKHSSTNVDVKYANCLEDGYRTSICTECGYMETTMIYASNMWHYGHDYVECKRIKPTCTTDGYTSGEICSLCGKIYTGVELIPKTGHTLEIIPAVEPTYVKVGYTEGKKCTVCGETIVEQRSIARKTLSSPAISLSNVSKGIKIEWKRVVGATGYKVYRNTKLIKTISSGSTTSFTDTSTKNGIKYSYKIYAIAGTNKSKASSTKNLYYLIPPTIEVLDNIPKYLLDVKYSKNTKVSGYQIKYSENKSFSGSKTISISNSGTISKRIRNLKKGKTYYVKVRSFKNVNSVKYYSAWSNTKYSKITK